MSWITDVCFGQLIREERLLTQATLEQKKFSTAIHVAYLAQGKGRGRDISKVQCFSCKDYNHIATNCDKKFCNYCKQAGHIIKECPVHPQNHQATAYQVALSSHPAGQIMLEFIFAPLVLSAPTVAGSTPLTLEMVQQMTILTFSTLQLQGSGINGCHREGA